MANFTTNTIIKKHLQLFDNEVPNIFNERILLSATNKTQLANVNIDVGSETVKALLQVTPTQEAAVILTGTTFVSLANALIAIDTVLVAKDSNLSVVYAENLDYVVDYTAGKIARTTGSTISNPQTVFIAYNNFTSFVKDTDYNIDFDAGQINRTSGSAIKDESYAFIDYANTGSTITDDIINQAILEAEAFMVERLKATFTTSSSDQGLKTSATYFSLAIIALSQAVKEGNRLAREDSAQISQQWRLLHDRYFNFAVEHFQKFSLSAIRAVGGVIQNRLGRASRGHQLIASPPVSIRQRRH